ncbi:MAG: GatB/YqeY domain-containing protein [Planctomycetota bacterium]
MDIVDRINEDLKAAMKAGETLKRDTLRMLTSALKNAKIEKLAPLDEAEVMAVVRSGVKSRRDSAEQYRAANRADLAEKEEAEIGILEGYLPKQLDEAATRALVESIIADTGVTGKAGLGVVMKAVMAKHRDVIDGKLVQRLLGELLQ